MSDSNENILLNQYVSGSPGTTKLGPFIRTTPPSEEGNLHREPAYMAKDLEQVLPDELRAIPNWLTWKAGEVGKDGKFTKVPIGRDGTSLRWQKPNQWMPFDEATRIALENQHSGVGLVLPAQATSGEHIVALDFDGVDLGDPTSLRLQEIRAIHAALGHPYWETSPSGRGIRMFVRSSEATVQISSANPLGGKDELFCSSPRWVTVTGFSLGSSCCPDASAAIGQLAARWRERKPPLKRVGGKAKTETGNPLAHLIKGWQGWPVQKLRDGDGREEMMLSYAGHIRSQGLRQGEIERLCLQANEDHYADKLDPGVVLDRARRYATECVRPDPQLLQLDSFGDIRNARAFAQLARGRFLHISTRSRWLEWTESRWVLCEKDEHIARAKEICTQILLSAHKIFAQNQERGKKFIIDAMAAHNLPKVLAMLKLAESEPGMAVIDSELDSDPYLLGVGNGVIDLRTGEHQPNRPEFLITRYCNADYSDEAACDKWNRFLLEIFQDDRETIESVQRLLGCSLLGLTREETLVICFGFGSNGKSVFANVIHKILGGYSQTAASSLLSARRKGDSGPRNDLAALAGARYVSINEMQAGDRLDEQVVKLLAGREPIAARFLHKEHFEFQPTFTPWLRTNHKPMIWGEDDGIWRRLVMLKFGRNFSEAERDPDLEEKLLAERDGILMWMTEGARLYLKDGIKQSPSMKAELGSYRRASDLLGEFLQDRCAVDPAATVLQKDLYFAYDCWCSENGLSKPSKKSFTQRLAERGFMDGRTGGQRVYVGLRLKSLTE